MNTFEKFENGILVSPEQRVLKSYEVFYILQEAVANDKVKVGMSFQELNDTIGNIPKRMLFFRMRDIVSNISAMSANFECTYNIELDENEIITDITCHEDEGITPQSLYQGMLKAMVGSLFPDSEGNVDKEGAAYFKQKAEAYAAENNISCPEFFEEVKDWFDYENLVILKMPE